MALAICTGDFRRRLTPTHNSFVYQAIDKIYNPELIFYSRAEWMQSIYWITLSESLSSKPVWDYRAMCCPASEVDFFAAGYDKSILVIAQRWTIEFRLLANFDACNDSPRISSQRIRGPLPLSLHPWPMRCHALSWSSPLIQPNDREDSHAVWAFRPTLC